MEIEMSTDREPCEVCDDGEGGCVFPYYGVAPHKHAPGPVIGSTVIDAPEMWPEEFREDPDAPGCGTYTNCPICGRGEQA